MSNRQVVLVLGGCRSGKSSYALTYAERFLGEQNRFIATCVPTDNEMKERVARHQADRDNTWLALEVPVRIDEAIQTESTQADVILIDCLTLWMNNLFGETDDQNTVDAHVNRLTDALKSAQCPIILVSNELGSGIVPENALARRYRDAVGWMNQSVAAAADKVVLTVAGIPMFLKDE